MLVEYCFVILETHQDATCARTEVLTVTRDYGAALRAVEYDKDHRKMVQKELR